MKAVHIIHLVATLCLFLALTAVGVLMALGVLQFRGAANDARQVGAEKEIGVDKPGPPANYEKAIRKAVKEFFGDLDNGSFRGAYNSMSLAYQKRTDLKSFDQFIEKNPGLKLGANHISRMDGVTGVVCKVRKLAKDNVYECDIATNGEYTNYRRNINITLRVVQEEGCWKIDDFVEVKDKAL